MTRHYKLVYFDAAGRAEFIRWIFAYAGQDYEDFRIKRETWPDLKANTPFGSLPYLEVDGKPLGQSMAIARYLARQFGLAGSDDFEAAKIDALADYITDASKPLGTAMHEKDEAKKAALKHTYYNETVHQYLAGLERHLQANHNGDSYLVGTKPTWIDFAVTVFMDRLVGENAALLDKYPHLKAHSQRVHELKGIKEWLKKRPS